MNTNTETNTILSINTNTSTNTSMNCKVKIQRLNILNSKIRKKYKNKWCSFLQPIRVGKAAALLIGRCTQPPN